VLVVLLDIFPALEELVYVLPELEKMFQVYGR